MKIKEFTLSYFVIYFFHAPPCTKVMFLNYFTFRNIILQVINNLIIDIKVQLSEITKVMVQICTDYPISCCSLRKML